MIDFDKFTFEVNGHNPSKSDKGTKTFKEWRAGGDWKAYYGGKLIGKTHKVTSYPMGVYGVDGKQIGSYGSTKEALTALHNHAFGLKFPRENIFPPEHYILRATAFVLNFSPDPNIKPNVSFRLYYNSLKTTGKSAASKPARSELATYDPETKTITSKSKLTFVNEAYFIAQIQEALEEAFQEG